ncbi:uncharacterized protein LOC143214972 [Lasioglossum baleicum]|uniref:uncharacterized protein LOC143214972 n=1 Tax=Lasioglossum baleicum TaxID=434251 RepID=UPI003FCE3473
MRNACAQLRQRLTGQRQSPANCNGCNRLIRISHSQPFASIRNHSFVAICSLPSVVRTISTVLILIIVARKLIYGFKVLAMTSQHKMNKQVAGRSISPPRRNPSGKFVDSGQKEIMINLYKYTVKEKPDMKYKQLVEYLSKQTGIGRSTVVKTLSEYRSTGIVTSPNKKRARPNILEKMSDEHLVAIRKKIYEFWFRREIPNLKKVLQAVNSDDSLPSFSESTMYRLLKRMDFKFFVKKRISALIEEPNTICWRQRYIRSIRDLRSKGRPIYFLDEMCINTGDGRRKSQVDTSDSSSSSAPSGKDKRLVVAHVGSSDGFIPGALLCIEAKKSTGDFHNEIDADTFFEWFRKIVPMLRDGAVIVMDDASYHSVKTEQYPTKNSKRSDIISWLKGKGEKPEQWYVKVQLMDLVEKYKAHESSYVIDEYAKEHGCTVLRIPPHHCEFNPIEHAWAKMKEYIKTRNTTHKLADVRQLVVEAAENVSVENWQDFIATATEEESKIYQLDHTIDSVLDENGDWLNESGDSDDDTSYVDLCEHSL